MQFARKMAFVLVCITITTTLARSQEAENVADLKAQLQALQQQAASMMDQIQLLQHKIDRATSSGQSPLVESAGNATPLSLVSFKPAPATAGTAEQKKDAAVATGEHRFFERKQGPGVTFYVPGGELTTYANLDVSVEAETKGLNGKLDGNGNPPVGNTGWIPGLSTNLSYIGIRGFQSIKGLPFNFVYQLETQLDIAATSGIAETNSNQSNVVKGGLTSRNSFVGISSSRWGSLMFGKTDAPYKQSTIRMDPFFAMIGDYQVIMGNTGGDNRVEFGTRLDHSIWYRSPNMKGVVFDALVSPGQNRADNNDNIASGESDCTGGNVPGSGGIVPISCSDGSFGLAASTSLSYTRGPLYLTAAYERHQKVNRSSDIVAQFPSGNAEAQLLVAKDTATEDAGKVGLMYSLSKQTTIGGFWETMHRYVPSDLQFQNERQRMGTWIFASQNLPRNFSVHLGWAHAFRTPGDPGQHNDANIVPPGGDPTQDSTAGANAPNQANLYTFALKRQLNKNLLAYINWAYTVNAPAGHFDLGAGGRTVTTDCHDAFDATGGLVASNPHCWTGGNLMGVAAGLNFKF